MIISYVFFAPADGVGEANSMPNIQIGLTDKHDDQVSQLWHACRKNYRQPEIITIEELSGRGAEQLTTYLWKFSTLQTIPLNFYQELNPTTETSMCCVASTLMGYFGKYTNHMHNIDTDHPDWKDLSKDE